MRRAGLLAAGLMLLGAGYALGQATEERAGSPDLELLLHEKRLATAGLYRGMGSDRRIDGKRPAEVVLESAPALRALYRRGATEEPVFRALVTQIGMDYHTLRGHANSAPQASQVAAEAAVRLQLLQVEQNRRVIELLEQLAAKK